MECEKCHKNIGKFYQFYVGKTMGGGSYSRGINPVEYITEYYYSNIESKEAVICDSCIWKIRRRAYVEGVGLLFFGFLGFMVVGEIANKTLYNRKSLHDTIIFISRLVGMISGFLGIGCIIMGIFWSRKNIGAEVGIEVHSNSLKEEGFNCFWTPKQYKALQ